MKLSSEIAKAKLAIQSRGNCQFEGFFSESDLYDTERILNQLMISSSSLIQPFRHRINCDRESHSQQLELIRPSVLSRALRKGVVFRKARALASELLGGKAHYQFDHVIYKSPMGTSSVPWHQDQAYAGPKQTPLNIHVWIPFQDSGPTNGGMIFIEETRHDLLDHAPVVQGSRTLTLMQPLPGKPRYVRVKRGGLSVHHNYTVHASGANHGNQPRKAWILHFGRSPLWQKYWRQLWG